MGVIVEFDDFDVEVIFFGDFLNDFLDLCIGVVYGVEFDLFGVGVGGGGDGEGNGWYGYVCKVGE